jgi:hypothetical protein
MIIEFPHKAPKNYSYEFHEFKKNVTAIWICDHHHHDYNHGKKISCIWGFYNSKTRKYHAPINSKTIGSVVDISSTTCYSAMQIKMNPLEALFYS